MTEAAQAVTAAEGKATTEAPIQPPVWLLPAALDLIAFVMLWAGFRAPALPVPQPIKRKRRRKVTKPRPSPAAAQLRVVASR